MQTWVQGALHFRDAQGTKQCPICHVPATAKHVLWLCKWHRTQQHKPLPPEWLERITNPEEEALWSKGWIPLEPQEHLQQDHPYQGHGVWKELQPIGPDQYAGFAFTLDATPNHYDTRSQIWVFGLCLTQTSGQLKRLGAITGAASGQQTKGRALFAGLVALAKHTTTPAKVIAQLSTVWEAWQKPPHRHPYPDLLAEVTDQDRHRITVLYISKNTRTPDAPGNEPQLRRRQRDAALTAWERADALHDRRQTNWQATLDRDHKAIYLQAAQRLEKIFQDKQHYLHTKADRQPGKHTKQRKKDLIQQCTKPWQEPHHRWAPQRSGYACTACGTRMHQGLTAQQLEDRLAETCTQQLAESACPDPGQEAPKPTKKLTRVQVIKPRSTRPQHQTSTILRKPKDTSNAPSVAPAFTKGSMNRPSMTTSRDHAWIAHSMARTMAIPVTTFRKKARRSAASFVACSCILTAIGASSPQPTSSKNVEEPAPRVHRLSTPSSSLLH